MATAIERKNDVDKVLKKYEPYFRNDIALVFQAKKGLKPQAIFDFVDLSELPHPLVEEVFHKSMKTFQNYFTKNTLLDAPTSEKLLKLFALYQKGTAVFGSIEAFREWLTKPAYGVGNVVPQTILDTATGIDLINEELVRIEYGDLA